MGRKKNMTPPSEQPLSRREEKFVKILVSSDGLITMRECAIQAGVKSCSAHSRAYEMVRRPRVAHAIAQYRAELDEMYAVNYKRSERDLKIIRDAAMNASPPSYSAAVQSEVARGKLAGLYTTKSEIRTGAIDAMTREEVEQELERIRQGFGEVIDITPEEEETETEEHRGRSLEADDDGSEDNQQEDRTDPAGELGDTGGS
jgi:phage terminase small subunit